MVDKIAVSGVARINPLPLVAVGMVAGFLSGMFGIGGGTIIVPALVLWLAVGQKIATGTSVASILPTAILGTLSYGTQGEVAWAASASLAVGMLIGAQFGSAILARIKVSTIQWGFAAFLLVVIVSLWFVVPQRDDVMTTGPLASLALFFVGILTGTFGGVLGVGGGIVVVPVLMFFMGASDLVAKGTSLAMMIPGSISGTIGNVRRGNVDLRSAAVIGLAACVFVPVGHAAARAVEPFWANVAFSIYLALVMGQLLMRRMRSMRILD